MILPVSREFQNDIEKYANFSCKLGKLEIQIKDDYYINWKITQI